MASVLGHLVALGLFGKYVTNYCLSLNFVLVFS